MNDHWWFRIFQRCSAIPAGRLVAIYVALAASWLLCTELIVSPVAEKIGWPADLLEAIGYIVFVALTACLLFLAKQQQQQDQQQLQNQQQQLIEQFYALPFVGMAITSPKTKRWLQVNDRLCQILGYPKDALLQLTWSEITHSDDLDLDTQLFTDMLLGQRETYQMEKRFVRKDGEPVHVRIDVRCQRDHQGIATRIFCTVDDISERLHHEAQIREINRLYRVVSNISQAIVRHTSLEQVLQAACDIAVHDGGFHMVWIGLVQDDEQLKPVAYTGETKAFMDSLHLSLRDLNNLSPTLTALRESRCVVCNNLANEPGITPAIREYCLSHGYRSYVVLPLIIDGITRGNFTISSGQIDFFDAAELELLAEVAGDLAFAIGLIDAEQTKQKILAELEESQSTLLLAIEAANLGIWDTNLETGLATVSDSYYTMLGFAPQSFPATLDWWFSRMHPEDRDSCQASMQLQMEEQHERIGVMFRFQHNDDSWHWIAGTGRVAERNADGKPTRLVGINMDVTSRVELDLQHTRDAERATGLLTLTTAEFSLTEKELLQYGLDLAEKLTDSKIGFLHFVNDDQQTIELVTWSTGTMVHCHAAYDQHYPIGQAGIWADCFHQRQAIICNDYTVAPNKKGVPEGHFPLYRFISLPTISDGKVHMIMGVGNSATDYTQRDVATVQLIANDLWRIVQRRRAEQALMENLQEQVALNTRLEDAQNQLLQSEKLAAIGQLAAGVAHELNNPIGFVHSNLGTLEGYVNDLMEITEACQSLKDQMQTCPQMAALDALMLAKDYAYIRGDLPQLISESKEGLGRVRRIVQDLKDFSRTGETTWEWADLHKGLDSTLNIVWNELKYKCTVNKEYGNIPEVYCLASQLNQVFMNLLVNASHAIEKHGEITIRTGTLDDRVWIEISDTGKGIPAELITKIFDPFFTTKPVGQGTGLGLSLSYSIMQRHNGNLSVSSVVGVGSTFRIELPVKPEQEGETARETHT